MTLPDKALEMINESQLHSAQGVGHKNPNSRELTIKTMIYQDTGIANPHLELTEAPKYNTVPMLIDSGCTRTVMDA